jgi:cytochrome c
VIRMLTLSLIMVLEMNGAPDAFAADIARGQLVFGECGGCHALGPHASIKAGPPLNGIVGRQLAAYHGYEYSAALSTYRKTETIWTSAALDKWLTGPQKLVAGTKMYFRGLPNGRDRRDVIAYLAQFSAHGTKTAAH